MKLTIRARGARCAGVVEGDVPQVAGAIVGADAVGRRGTELRARRTPGAVESECA